MTIFLSLCLFGNGQKKYHSMDQYLPVISLHVSMAYSLSLCRRTTVWGSNLRVAL